MPDATARVLLIDDGAFYAQVVRSQLPELQLLEPAGTVEGRFEDGSSALGYLDKHADSVDLVLLDMQFDLPEERLLPLEPPQTAARTRRFQGVAILRRLRARHPRLPVVLLTAQRDLSLVDVDGELASQSMTYVLDGEDLDALRIRVHAALAEARLSREEADVLWGGDRQMAALRRRLSVLARGGMPLILEGETGTGKSYLAERFVHRNSGRSGSFVVLDLSTLPQDLVAAQLFGAVRGAYTGAVRDHKGVFESAHRGTLFIDEVQNVPLEVQRQLLVVLQDKRVRPLGSHREIPIDVKVVAASNDSLERAVAEGRFRADLYMRLSPATRVRLPPLRERASDLAFFARRFTARSVEEPDLSALRDRVALAAGLSVGSELVLTLPGRKKAPIASGLELSLPQAAWAQLEAHSWPGNLRELQMVMHNLAAFTLVAAVDALEAGVPVRSPRLQVDPGLVGQLLSGSRALAAAPASGASDAEGAVRVTLSPQRTLNQMAQHVERQYLRELFRRTGGDFSRMAELLLGDAERTRAVRLRLNQLGIKVRELRSG